MEGLCCARTSSFDGGVFCLAYTSSALAVSALIGRAARRSTGIVVGPRPSPRMFLACCSRSVDGQAVVGPAMSLMDGAQSSSASPTLPAHLPLSLNTPYILALEANCRMHLPCCRAARASCVTLSTPLLVVHWRVTRGCMPACLPLHGSCAQASSCAVLAQGLMADFTCCVHGAPTSTDSTRAHSLGAQLQESSTCPPVLTGSIALALVPLWGYPGRCWSSVRNHRSPAHRLRPPLRRLAGCCTYEIDGPALVAQRLPSKRA